MPLSKPPVLLAAARHTIEQVIFTSRWLLAPIYAGLSVGLLVLLVRFVITTGELVSKVLVIDTAQTIVGVLGLVDLALMGSLLLIVIFAGYENFVAKLNAGNRGDKLSWMGHVEFTDLKLKLMASIVAISAIRLLEDFMNLKDLSDRDLAWGVAIHLSFVISGVLLAVMDQLTRKVHRERPVSQNPRPAPDSPGLVRRPVTVAGGRSRNPSRARTTLSRDSRENQCVTPGRMGPVISYNH
jgi:uncharacterized protein (TIGR00645 family)